MVEAGDIITLTAGAWRVQAPLKSASYGEVWRAESVLDGTPAAVKLVNRAQMDLALPAQRAVWRACFEAEIAFLRALQPWDLRHIVRLLDSGEHDGLPALALELLDGDLACHLAALRSRGDSPGVDLALAWTAQVNGALAKVHQYGWRYLDLKPANLLVDAHGGVLKLADFGTNRPLQDSAAHSYAGTAAWQAPEQFFPDDAGRYRTDARSDYFALGALLYYLVAGIPLRFCAACADAYRTHGTAGAAALRARAGAAPPAILAPDETALFLARASARDHDALLVLLRALLAPRPEARPRHALEISRLIARAAASLERAPIALRSAA
jgi:eukaryotic-like serine/threonine-protein kinase